MIAVALATFNGSPYLRQQLDSLAEQTLRPAELVVSDDGSTDATRDIVAAFARAAPFPVRLLHQPSRLGFADNFLAAATATRERLIAFCDQDDVWLPEKLAGAAEALTDARRVLFIHQSRMVDPELNPLGELDQDLPRRRRIRPLTFDAFDRAYGHCMVFRRDLLEVGDLPRRPLQPRQPGRLAHDQLVMQIASLFGDIVISPRQLTLYRQHHHATYGAGEAIHTPAADYTRPALSDYAIRMDFYRDLRAFLSNDRAREVAGDIGQVSLDEIRSELQGRVDLLAARTGTYAGVDVLSRAGAYVRSVAQAARMRSIGAETGVKTALKDAVFGVLLKRGTTR